MVAGLAAVAAAAQATRAGLSTEPAAAKRGKTDVGQCLSSGFVIANLDLPSVETAMGLVLLVGRRHLRVGMIVHLLVRKVISG